MAYHAEQVKCMKGLKIVHINARSLLQHFDEFSHVFLDCRFDIVVFTETWLHSNCTDSLLHVNGYKLYRLDCRT